MQVETPATRSRSPRLRSCTLERTSILPPRCSRKVRSLTLRLGTGQGTQRCGRLLGVLLVRAQMISSLTVLD